MKRLIGTLLLTLTLAKYSSAQDKTEPPRPLAHENSSKLTTLYYVYIPYTEGRFAIQGEIPCILTKDQTISIRGIGTLKITKETTDKEIIQFVVSRMPKSLRASVHKKIRVRKSQFILKDLQKEQDIHISGSIEKPLNLKVGKTGKTLKEVIELSNPTQFAALNRVELLRNGVLYKYDAKKEHHQSLKVYPRDVIYVPVQHVIGR